MSTNSTTPPGPYSVADFDYELPDELIAQAPSAVRSDSRLLVMRSDAREHAGVRDLPGLLRAGDRLVFNDTRVVPARAFGRKATGGRIEFMLERFEADGRASARIRASKSPGPGARLLLESGDGQAVIELEVTGRDGELYTVQADDSLPEFLHAHGAIPLPPYIERRPDAADAERYQTVYAREPGAVAAPTAGLHFDLPLLDALAGQGIDSSRITLHVGAGTFQPIRVQDPSRHVMHAERVSVSRQVVDEIQATRAAGGRIVAIGTTSVRALESAAAGGTLEPMHGETRLFLTPGSPFRIVDALLTNFHLPRSTLLMLVSALAGRERTLAAYREAVAMRYRFFSYGDAMLILPAE